MKTQLHIILALGALCACSPVEVNAPQGSQEAPMQVTVTHVNNYPGRAVIHYTLPHDVNMKYVKAVYSPRKGQTADVKASFYIDSLVVEGFENEGEYSVNLHSVSYGECESLPVVVKVNPLTPPYRKVMEDIRADATFGGLFVEFQNPAADNLAICVLKKSPEGRWEEIHTQYTASAGGKFSVRGQESVETEFGIFVRDRWGNISDTRSLHITPLFEAVCEKQLFKKMTLTGDSYLCHSWNEASKANDMVHLWDDVVNDIPCFQSKTNTVLPQWFTFDMGAVYQLSRFVVHSRVASNFANVFKAGHPRTFEIWGSMEPNPNGAWDESWYLIGDYESFRPSGATTAVSSSAPLTDEEKQLAQRGEEYLVEDGVPAARYIRFKTKSTWGAVVYVHMSELSFYGSQLNK